MLLIAGEIEDKGVIILKKDCRIPARASLLLLLLVILARPAAAAPRINAVFGGSVLETMNTGMSSLWNPALSAYNDDISISFYTIGSGGFFTLLKNANNVMKEGVTEIATYFSPTPPYSSAAGYFIGYSGKWFGCTLSVFAESTNHAISSATTFTLNGSYCFQDVPIFGNVSLGGNLHLFGGSKVIGKYNQNNGLFTTDAVNGHGFALDLGIITEITDQLHLGLVVRDAFYGFRGDRIYRTVDSNGTLFAELTEQYIFDWDNKREHELIFSGGASEPYWDRGLFARASLDIGVALLPWEEDKIHVRHQRAAVRPFRWLARYQYAFTRFEG